MIEDRASASSLIAEAQIQPWWIDRDTAETGGIQAAIGGASAQGESSGLRQRLALADRLH